VLVAVPRERAVDLEPLRHAYAAGGIAATVLPYGEVMPSHADLAAACDGWDGIVLAGPGRCAPRTVLAGPFVESPVGCRVPAAWLPLKNAHTVRRFAAMVASVHQRPRARATVALLGQWHPRYLRLADRIETILERAIQTFRWTGDVIAREEVVRALGSGLGLALYVGHGRPVGWVGYYGMRTRHFDDFAGQPLGAVLSLCCRTASRRRTGLSYSEGLPLNGVAAASFGAVTETRHLDNTRWAVRICDALLAGAESVGDLIVRSAPLNPSACAPYRIIGDPLAPIAGDPAAATRARRVRTYA
jgi:hypothetical protein